jgi:hypothetical protein
VLLKLLTQSGLAGYCFGHEYFSPYPIAIETGSAGQGTDRGTAKRIDQTVWHRADEDRDACKTALKKMSTAVWVPEVL